MVVLVKYIILKKSKFEYNAPNVVQYYRPEKNFLVSKQTNEINILIYKLE